MFYCTYIITHLKVYHEVLELRTWSWKSSMWSMPDLLRCCATRCCSMTTLPKRRMPDCKPCTRTVPVYPIWIVLFSPSLSTSRLVGLLGIKECRCHNDCYYKNCYTHNLFLLSLMLSFPLFVLLYLHYNIATIAFRILELPIYTINKDAPVWCAFNLLWFCCCFAWGIPCGSIIVHRELPWCMR